MTEPSDTMPDAPTPAAMPQQAPADDSDGSLELPENLEAAKKLRSENKNLRERLKALEGEHEAATTRLTAMQHTEVERLAREHLRDPADLWNTNPTPPRSLTSTAPWTPARSPRRRTR